MSASEATTARAPIETLVALAESGRALVAGVPLADALDAVAVASASATAAELAILRVAEGDALVARAVAGGSPALAAELLGTRIPLGEAPEGELDDLDALPDGLRAVARRVAATEVLVVSLAGDGALEGTLELYRRARAFDQWDRVAARLAAGQAVLAFRTCPPEQAGPSRDGELVELAGDALAAATDDERAADRIARLAARVTGADAAWIWEADGGEVELAGRFGDDLPGTAAAERARAIVGDVHAVGVDRDDDGALVSLQLGQPPLGALQLRFAPGRELGTATVAELGSFGVRAAHALRSSARTRELVSELSRSRALLEVVGQAIAELSLAHTLDTAVARVAEVLGTDRVAVYLQEDGRLEAAAVRGLEGEHELVAARLLELALGPSRLRGLLVLPDAVDDPRLADVEDAARAVGVEAALALPLVVGGDVIGLLAAFPRRRRTPGENEAALLVALASQLAVAVQNARLHERAKSLGAELEHALAAERQAARRLGALYEISRSFAQSLSLEATLEAVATTVAESLEVDAAAIRLPDARGAQLEARALHVAEPRLAEVARAILGRPQPIGSLPVRRLLRTAEPLVLEAGAAAELGGAYALLAPFLAKGSTAAVVPIATPAEVLGTLTIVSFQAGRPIGGETIAAALSIAAQAALAIDNARLYQQQKAFADTMQRSLLPRSAPRLPGLELGDVYEPAATVDVGGDVYDYLALADGRLAVVLGDVTGHGVDATADMAMAKFVFRSLAREHPEPGGFLAAANEVVVGEIGPGKFITMVELVADPAHGRLACASAGHPAPRLVLADGRVEPIPVRGLALGIDAEQAYEAVETDFPPGASVAAFTDGVIEARRDGELFGLERLDRVLASRRNAAAGEIARAMLEACRSWSDGNLTDDCAVVVIKRPL